MALYRKVMVGAMCAAQLAMYAVAQDGGEDGGAAAQGGGGGEEGGLNRETVEHLLRVVSPSCREEMQEALSEQTELSGECKEEIQSALRERTASNPNAGAGAAQALPAEPQDNTAIYLILLFVLLFVGALGGFCWYVNEEKKKLPPPKAKKKKGKKWLAKQKAKGKQM